MAESFIPDLKKLGQMQFTEGASAAFSINSFFVFGFLVLMNVNLPLIQSDLVLALVMSFVISLVFYLTILMVMVLIGVIFKPSEYHLSFWAVFTNALCSLILAWNFVNATYSTKISDYGVNLAIAGIGSTLILLFSELRS